MAGRLSGRARGSLAAGRLAPGYLCQVAGDCSPLLIAVHPFGSGPETVAGDGQRRAGLTLRAELIALLLAQSASPAAIFASQRVAHGIGFGL